MYMISRMLKNARMKTIDEIYRDNLRLLAAEHNSVVAVADLIGCSSSQYSQWMNGSENSGTGKPRGMRVSTARRIEKACGKPAGWMDKVHDDNEREVEELLSLFQSLGIKDRQMALTMIRAISENAAQVPR
jgi:hypothetical protein